MQGRLPSVVLVLAVALGSFAPGPARAADPAETGGDLAELSLADLMDIEVTSVSKKAERLTDAAAAITVITNDDIRRSGMTTVPEVLRLVPGVQVARVDANRWAISARGFNGAFSNKLLVMIDGRSVYTPLFGGTYWDAQDYPLEDIERIEVIRGPGGTLWGANAVNGIINVITKKAADTQGGLLSGHAGNYESGGTVRYGIAGDDMAFRVYARGFQFDDFDVDDENDGQDRWWNVRAGARLDAEPTDRDSLTVSADLYHIRFDQGGLELGAPPSFDRKGYEVRGENLLARWRHELSERSAFSLKAYYDHTLRDAEIRESRDAYDVEAQVDHALPRELLGIGERLSFSVGGNYRASADEIDPVPATSFDPNDQTIHLADFFLQGKLDLLEDRLSFVAGSKLGWNSFSGFEYQPSLRAIWAVAEGHNVWAAGSRAVRLPTRADHDLAAAVAGLTISGNNGIDAEELWSGEIGYRFFALERVTADVTAFYNWYDRLHTLIVNPNAPGLLFENGTEATAAGVEAEVNVKPFDWWRLTAGYAYLYVDSKPKPGAINFSASPDDQSPQHEVKLRSNVDLPWDLEFDSFFQWVDKLNQIAPSSLVRNEKVDDYFRLDLRLGWKPQDWLELSFAAQNVLDRRHWEYDDTAFNESTKVPRTYYGKATITF